MGRPRKYGNDEERRLAKNERNKQAYRRLTPESRAKRLSKQRETYVKNVAKSSPAEDLNRSETFDEVAEIDVHDNENSRPKKARLENAIENTEAQTNVQKRAAACEMFNNFVSEHNLGQMNIVCPNQQCLSLNFKDEKGFSRCCKNGQINLPIPRNYPDLLKALLTKLHPNSNAFMEHIRSINSSLAFASMGANLAPPPGFGPYCFRIHGQIYHRTGALHPPDGSKRKFAQLYILDQSSQSLARQEMPGNKNVPESLMESLTVLMNETNPYAEAYRFLHEVEKKATLEAQKNKTPIPNVCMTFRKDKSLDQRRYNEQKANEVAVIFDNVDGEPPFNRDIIVYPKSPDKFETKHIDILDPNLDPLIYPVFFPYGEKGWHPNIPFSGAGKRVRVSQMEYYSFQLSVRNQFNPILNGGKLTQQYFVDAYVKMEANRLNFIRLNQQKLRCEKYNGLMDHILSEDNTTAPGKVVILPSSFEGSPRNCQQRYQDAMAIVTKFGKPDLFVTMTCNPKWKEITENLNGQSPENRPDIISRVFRLKLSSLLYDIEKHNLFGKVKACVHVIEFQKRGLPHAHMLIILDEHSKIRTPEDVDKIVSAELPDPTTQSRLFEIVTTNMIHGPCGPANPKCVCMVDGKCTKNFPKQFRNTTNVDVNGYPEYKRRISEQIKVKDKYVDNRWVVPYNSYLLLKYNCHINVEICASVKSVKYLFKYVYKGHDAASIDLKLKDYDEPAGYVNARYVSPPEAAWRLFGFKMHKQSHSIMRLAVHLPEEQNVYFSESEHPDEALNRASQRQTTLMAWFSYNKHRKLERQNKSNAESEQDKSENDDLEYFYREFPEHFVFKPNPGKWQKRQKGGERVIGRMYSVNPRDMERFCLRLLLLHVKGATSFDDLKTGTDGKLYCSFQDSAKQRGLLLDDEIWKQTLLEATQICNSYQLCNIFAYLCAYVLEGFLAKELWAEFKPHMMESFCFKLHPSQSHEDNNDLHCCEDYALAEVMKVLKCNGRKCSDFGLRNPPRILASIKDVYDLNYENESYLHMEKSLNDYQRKAFKEITSSLDVPLDSSKCFFIDGPGGSGKTYLYTTLMHYLRGKNKVVLPSASTGIAANLLIGGRTYHSLFGLPVPLNETSVSRITANTEAGRDLKNADVLIIDECTMASSHTLNVIDRLLRELTGYKIIPFGGKVVVLGGDFRQCLTIIPHGSPSVIIESSIKYSPLWSSFKMLALPQNMRSIDPNYSDWLLKLGNGSLSNNCGLANDIIEIESSMICNDCIVKSTFGDVLTPNLIKSKSNTAILCAKNQDVDEINTQVLEILDGESKSYLGTDSIITDDDQERANFPTEFLNTLTPSGMPNFCLTLKVGAIIMLLRNLNTKEGLCNGTRLVVLGLENNIIRAEVLTGSSKGNQVFIPRIDLSPSETGLPFQLRRRQFPVKLAFAMTINKSQGQTFDKVGVLLPEPVFGHGQLYVACSRVRRRCDIKLKILETSEQGHCLGDDRVFTKNVVYSQIFSA